MTVGVGIAGALVGVSCHPEISFPSWVEMLASAEHRAMKGCAEAHIESRSLDCWLPPQRSSRVPSAWWGAAPVEARPLKPGTRSRYSALACPRALITLGPGATVACGQPPARPLPIER